MRLLDAEALIYDDVAELAEFPDESKAPPYAILSHTWEDEEVLFADIALGPQHDIRPSIASSAKQRRREAMLDLPPKQFGQDDNETDALDERIKGHPKFGWNKILNACLRTLRDGYSYIWIDTCKSS